MKIHFIGIGGIGMSALARLYHAQKHEVTGSDATDSPLLVALRKEGIRVVIGHSFSNVPADVDFVIYSEAIPLDNPELEAVRAQKISHKTYFEALGEWTRDKKAICIAGTHGKTTTTGLVSLLLMQAGLDPTVVIGSTMAELGHRNMRFGTSPYMVVEACEYRRSFLHLNPFIGVVTNIELDHTDYYRDLEDYVSAFRDFVKKIPKNGALIVNGEDALCREIAKDAVCSVFFFEASSADFSTFHLKVPGRHNLMNALAALTVGRFLGLKEEEIVKALESFKGVWRRFEYKGELNGAPVYDDYGHHPTEVMATLQGAREAYPNQRLVLVFQPHQHNRALHFLEGFREAFKLADEVIIPNIYAARDSREDREAMPAERFVKELQKTHPCVKFGDGFGNTVNYLKKSVDLDDLVVVMGAGDVWEVAEKLV
ncbi:MAG: Mur ligase family protein [Candidatus Gracilibacteria bacterium]